MTLTFAVGITKTTAEFICEKCAKTREVERPSHGGKLVCNQPGCGGFMVEAKPELHRDFAQELGDVEAKERAKAGK